MSSEPPLPRDYAAFLRARDGLEIEPERSCELECAGLPGQTISVATLFGAERMRELTRELAPEIEQLDAVIVVGEDGTGNYFVLDDPDVFYWDRARLHAFDERTPTIEDAGGDLFAVADSFETFAFAVIRAIRR